MNNLTSFQRKLVYLGVIVALMVPVIMLGAPPAPSPDGRIIPGSGGNLARMRVDYQLGEVTLGDVDPTSSTMNLLLLGFRGIATSRLWMDAQKQQRDKDWASLRSTTDSIIKLQPHFLKVWHFQGWNLAYNVSAEWDAVADRYYWVKEGIKFYQQGKERNESNPELYWYTGDTVGKKIGRSDEWVQFRRYFRKDPDTVKYPNGPDERINPQGKDDNYLVAREWFEQANEVLDKYGIEQHIMAESLFRSYPMRSRFDYAQVRQREGLFDERTRVAWEESFNDWTKRYGHMEFDCPIGKIHLEVTAEEMRALNEQEKDKEDLTKTTVHWIGRYQDMTNYRFWRTRAQVEREQTMVEAHRELYEGDKAYADGDFDKARDLLYSGMEKFQKMLDEFPDLKSEDSTVEEAMLAILAWRDCLVIQEVAIPDDGYPLAEIWKAHQTLEGRMKEELRRRRQR